MRELRAWANRLMYTLGNQQGVRSCRLFGSVAAGTWDVYSDIDIEIDVSGEDNGAYMLSIPDRLREDFTVVWHDFARSLMPAQYVVSVALDETDPFLFADILCIAQPHIAFRSREGPPQDPFVHAMKLWIINCKHCMRGDECRMDILRMCGKMFENADEQSDRELLARALSWLCERADGRYTALLARCAKVIL